MLSVRYACLPNVKIGNSAIYIVRYFCSIVSWLNVYKNFHIRYFGYSIKHPCNHPLMVSNMQEENIMRGGEPNVKL